MSRGTQPIVDASAHIFFKTNAEIRDYLHEPFKSRGIPDVEMDWYGAPGGEYAERYHSGSGDGPGSDPATVGRHLFEEQGVDIAILHPMTRGNVPDRHLASAIAAAYNDMLATRWLSDETYGERFRGTIRVCPDDVDGAIRELDRWADHPRMVQIGVPLQSNDLYGKPQYMPLWREAAARGLPVAVHIETGTGVTNPPTPNGHARTYAHYAAFMALNYLYHLMNMIAEGVFESLPDLKVVWADGGADLLTPSIWRMDVFGRPHLEQTPWAPQIPSAYLAGHVRFVHSNLDGAGTAEIAAEWLQMTGKTNLIMYGSSYPHWSALEPDSIPPDLTNAQRERLLWRNADDLYGLGLAAANSVPAATPLAQD
jgi:predicted TIM-barrel fold metal-dependent hydrolase